MRKWILLLLVPAFAISCKDEDVPPEENETEVITRVSFIFNPTDAGAPKSFIAEDPDGVGVQDFEILDEIVLDANTSYQLFISLTNHLTGDDITSEIEEEASDHMIFYEFSEDLFSSPTGNGNVDSRDGQVQYIDADSLNLPLGLITGWVTGEPKSGFLRILLKHQPGMKSLTSTASDGITDLDIEWPVIIE